jgi:anaerobic magnesium-protoporphyrin IX monomethyl ester cyclase
MKFMGRKKKILLWRPVSDIVKKSNHTRDFRVPFTLKYIQSLFFSRCYVDIKLIDSFISTLYYEQIINLTLLWKPDIIAISPTTTEHALCLDYAKKIKDKSSPYIIALGQDPSAGPARYVNENSNIDAVLIGEGEEAFVELVEAIIDKRSLRGIRGCYTESCKEAAVNIVEELDSLPRISYSPQEIRSYNLFYPLSVYKKIIWGHILTSRGCPYDCIFCSQTIRESYGKTPRFRSSSEIVKEIKYLMSMGANLLSFADDNFTTSSHHVNAVCDEIIDSRISIKWTAHARIDNMTEALMRKMKKSGCTQLRFGIETGSREILEKIRKSKLSYNWFKMAGEVFKKARLIGIDTVALFLVGSPDETIEDVYASIRLALEIDPDLLQVCFFTAYPGSPAYDTYKNKINISDLEGMYHYSPGHTNFSKMDNTQLSRMQALFYRKFYLRPSYIIRHFLKYGLFYLKNIRVFLNLSKTSRTMIG